MSCAIRISFARVISPISSSIRGVKCVGSRSISSVATRNQENREPKPAPYDYENRNFNYLNFLFDSTTKRLDDNSKVIVVEGPIASGKSELAKKLAKDLGMCYYPEANLDMEYINAYGYDLRRLDPQLPESRRSFDINNFLLNPRHRLAASFQIRQYSIRFSQYIDALAHVLSTGQGVVMDRSPFSDFAFLEAMYKCGYVSALARSAYYDIRKNSISELLRPHLVIYLDLPVENIQENIKKRNIPYEVNSTALTPKYLQQMEIFYKQKYLSEISKDAELLVYDWSNGGDVEVVVEDIEQIDFDRFDERDTQMRDWRFDNEAEWGVIRQRFADRKSHLLSYFNVPRFDVPELVSSGEDMLVYYNVMQEAPGEVYEVGFNTAMGDKNLWFKTSGKCRGTLPKRERRKQFDNIV